MPAWIAPLVLSMLGSGVTAAMKSTEAKRRKDEAEKRLDDIKGESTGPNEAQLAMQQQAIQQRAGQKQANLMDQQERLLGAAGMTSGQDIANTQRNIAGEFADIEQGQLMELAMAGMQEKEREDKDKRQRESAQQAVVDALGSDMKNPWFDAVGEAAQTTGMLAGSVPEVKATLMAKQASDSFSKQFTDNPEMVAMLTELYTSNPEMMKQLTESDEFVSLVKMLMEKSDG